MPHDRLIGRATGTDTSETYTYWGTSTATISVTAVDSVDGNQTAYADPLAIAPAAPTDLASQWSYTPGSTPSLALNWTNHSPIADGIEIDELSGDGQTYTTVYTGPIDYDTNSTTISVPNPDPDATYYLYETDNSGTTYSDPATVQPGIVPPTLAVTSNQLTSVTLAYSDPGGANMALYYDIPGVDNMHFCRNLGCGDGTVTVWEPVYDKVYSFQIDAYTDDQDVKSSVVNDLGTPAPIIINAQPVMDGSTYQDEYAITFTTTDPDLRHIGGSGYEAQLALWTGNDTYGLYSANTMGGCSIGEMALSYSPVSESGGVYTITATYYVLSEDSTVSFQIVAPNAPPSEKFTITNAQEVQSCTPVEITGLNADLTRDGMTDIVYNVNIPSGSLAGQPNWSDDYVDFYDVVNGQATFIGEQDDYPLSAGPVGPIYSTMYVSPFVVSNSLIPPGSQVFGVSLWELNTTYAENEWEHSDYSNFFTVPGTAGGGVIPAAPSDLTATLTGYGSAFLHWTDNSDNEDSFEIDARSPLGGAWIPVVTNLPYDSRYCTVTSDELAAAFGDDPDGTEPSPAGFSFQVVAVDGDSPPSNCASPSLYPDTWQFIDEESGDLINVIDTGSPSGPIVTNLGKVKDASGGADLPYGHSEFPRNLSYHVHVLCGWGGGFAQYIEDAIQAAEQGIANYNGAVNNIAATGKEIASVAASFNPLINAHTAFTGQNADGSGASFVERSGALLAILPFFGGIYNYYKGLNPTIIGSAGTYEALGEEIEGNFLKIPDETWNLLTDEQRWQVNQRFLDEAIASGKPIVLSSNPNRADPGGYFAKEIQYLISKGYVVSKDGLEMVPKGG